MPETTDLMVAQDKAIVTLTLNRPERRNAMSPEMLAKLNETLARISEDQTVGAVILTGAGNGFCAGGDVKAMAEGNGLTGTPEQQVDQLTREMEASRWLHEMPQPTIAMMRGAAAGAGLALALACDMRFVSDNAKFTTAFSRVGYCGDFGGSYFLTQLVGTAKARELYLTADLIDAGTALNLGMVNQVIPDLLLEGTTREVVSRIANGPRVANRYIKENMNAAEQGDIRRVFELEARNQVRCGLTDDHHEATKAFVEKREPAFKGC
jgi:2-(1,2-epoxy-1,2-dihydrophenyl)acetyl-CoA isomerase